MCHKTKQNKTKIELTFKLSANKTHAELLFFFLIELFDHLTMCKNMTDV